MVDVKITKIFFLYNFVCEWQSEPLMFCLAQPKDCATHIVHLHATQLTIDTTVNHFLPM